MRLSKNPVPSRDHILELFIYNRENGKLIWRERPATMFTPTRRSAEWQAALWNSRFAGKEAGAPNHDGYIRIVFGGGAVMAHRLIWKIEHDSDPDFIDHINGDVADNRISNLRSVPHLSNMRNKPIYKNNNSGVSGVFWEKRLGKWRAYIRVKQRPIHLGVFTNFDDAVAARQAAEVKYGFHENHGRGA